MQSETTTTPPPRERNDGRRYLAIRTADSAQLVCGGADAFGARDPPYSVNIPSGPMTAVLDYRAPLVVDGEPPQIVRIRPLLNAIVPRAIGLEARVLVVHSPLAQVEPRLGSGARNAMGAGFAGQFASRELAAADGPAMLQVRARDSFGNLAVSDPWPAVADSLASVIVVSGVTNNRPVADRRESGAVQALQRRRPHVLQCGVAADLTGIRQQPLASQLVAA